MLMLMLCRALLRRALPLLLLLRRALLRRPRT